MTTEECRRELAYLERERLFGTHSAVQRQAFRLGILQQWADANAIWVALGHPGPIGEPGYYHISRYRMHGPFTSRVLALEAAWKAETEEVKP